MAPRRCNAPENSSSRAPRVSTKRRLAIYERDGYRCVECGSSEDLTLDHITPVSKGGASKLENLRTMCEPCNQKKADTMLQTNGILAAANP